MPICQGCYKQRTAFKTRDRCVWCLAKADFYESEQDKLIDSNGEKAPHGRDDNGSCECSLCEQYYELEEKIEKLRGRYYDETIERP